jgi:hypothetical protein
VNVWSYLPLPLFPEGSLASSVITTVWVGVYVVVFFNLRFGWVLSGLVVPGYLVPLLIVKPWAAGVIFVEASATYAGVWFFSEYLTQWGRWSNFFGRDRFFALVLWSVVIRLTFDAWLLPAIGEAVVTYWQINFDYRTNLQSFGLIIIALVANQFWKTGFIRGLSQVLTTCGITYMLVRYGLMEFTNFNISNLGYLYEDFAASILGSPKAYMIIIATAFISSHLNLAYGWDFNGILIPSLVALQWTQPSKILNSFVETFILLVLAHLILKMPFFRRLTIEGGRKLLLFFNINFAYKLLIGHLIVLWFPEVKVTDYYAFGYLLPTIMAAKMHDKGIVVRLSRVTLQTSFIAAITASLAGFALTQLPTLSPWSSSLAAAVPPSSSREWTGMRLMEVVQADKATMYQPQGTPVSPPLPHEIDLFIAAIRSLQAYRHQPSVRLLTQARTLLARVHYHLDTIQDRYLYLYEAPPYKGWGLYVLDMQADPQGLLIEVPMPLETHNILEASTSFFMASEGHALAVAGTFTSTSGVKPVDQTMDILRTPQSFFHAFHREMARNNVLQIRGYNAKNTRLFETHSRTAARRGPERQALDRQEPVPQTSSLWIKSALPPGLDLVQLKTFTDTYRLTWDEPPFTNLQRQVTRTGFAELFLNRADTHKFLLRSQSTQRADANPSELPQLQGPLPAWLLQHKSQIADKGSNLYRPPSLEVLLYFDAEVLTPLMRLLQSPSSGTAWYAQHGDELRALHAAARAYGYQLVYHQNANADSQYLLLTEATDAPRQRRYWGTYVWRVGQPQRHIIQVPHPMMEAYTLEYGISLFERLHGCALLISGAHAEANSDGSSDVLNAHQPQNLFNLVHQVILREHPQTAMLVVQSRGFAYHPDRPTPRADMLMAFHHGMNTPTALPPLGLQLFRMLQQDGLAVRFVDGSAETIGYESTGVPQSKYMDATVHKTLVLLWLSPTLRSYYRQQSDNRTLAAQFNALRVPTLAAHLSDYVLRQGRWGRAAQLPVELITQLRHYIDDQDIIQLRQLTRAWVDYRFERLLDQNTDHAFLLVFTPADALSLVANLNPRDRTQTFRADRTYHAAATIAQFVETQAIWLELEE